MISQQYISLSESNMTF
uniref:Uncharacterized protein n=1 Tax=Rhizophora mucronata TaxID=61149 RepID=A0A2P2PR92_RHIMU